MVDGNLSDPTVSAGVQALVTQLEADSIFGPVTVTPNSTGDLALVSATLTIAPDSPESYDTIDRLRDAVIPAAFEGSSAEVFVTGQTAYITDFNEATASGTPLVFAFVLGMSFLLLLIAFRSVVVPAKAILMNLLSVGAAYGAIVLVFQKGIGAELLGFQQVDTIESWLPLFLCVLFGSYASPRLPAQPG